MASNDHELGDIAADPRTDWDTLHWIAENHPSLRPIVAENPATYPELLEALASIGDPEIDAALARHRSLPPTPETQISPPPPPSPSAPSSGAASGTAPLLPEQDDRSASGSALDVETTGKLYAVGAAAPQRTGSAGARAAAPPPRRRSSAPMVALAVLLPVLVLVALSALALSLLDGGSPEDSAAAEPAATEQAQQSEDEPSQEPTPSPTPEPPTPEELRAEVASLPEDSSCESPSEDREVFAALASATSENGSWVESSDGTLVQEALIGLQESCDSTHAAALFLDLRESEETANALRGTVQNMGSAWIQASFPAQGQQLSSFVSPDGNVLCELGDTLRCRVLQHSFSAPEGCTEGVTYAIRVDRTAEPDCENPVQQQGQPVLGYGETASNEFFACTAFQSQMSCWNQLTGEGINLSASRNSTY